MDLQKILIKYYVGNTTNSNYNDDIGNAYLIKFDDDGTVTTLYVGRFRNGQLHDESGEVWNIVYWREDMKRKYLFEAGLDVFTSFKTIVPIEYLAELSKFDSHLYHIYSVLSFEQFYFKKEKTYISSQGLHSTLFVSKDGNEIEYKLPVIPLEYGEFMEIELNMPYTFLTMKIKQEECLEGKLELQNFKETIYAQNLFIIFANCLVEKMEFKVLYVGQAYGKDGNRTAFDRLESHSTLQKILTDCQAKYANKHIYVMLMEFTPQLISTFDGVSKNYIKTEDESDQHMKEVLSNLPEFDQVINITEAALINYFKPEYNANFVENFPNENHKGYRQYFDLDYNSLCVEVDLEFDELNSVQLYSDANRIATSFDFIQYNLYNDNNRRSMYDIFRCD